MIWDLVIAEDNRTTGIINFRDESAKACRGGLLTFMQQVQTRVVNALRNLKITIFDHKRKNTNENDLKKILHEEVEFF